MIKIKEISEGKFTLTRKDKMLPGIYHKIEKVAENSNFYYLWSDKKHFCLYDAKSNRYALKSSTLSDAQTFSHIEYYSEESQSFVAYRSDTRYAHIIYEDGTFETQTFKYVGAEKNGLRPVQDFKNKWYYYDSTERKRIKKTRHGIQLGTEGRLGEMFSTGEYVVYYTPKKLRIFASVNDKTIKSIDYFESIEEIEGRFFIGKLYAKNVYTIIKDYHIITPIGYYTSMPQYIKEHNLFIAMKGSSWCVIYPNRKEIQNYQWTDECFLFTNKYIFNKKKDSYSWKIFNRENGQEVITRWKNIRLYNEVFFVDTETESMKRISDEDIEKENNDYIKSLQENNQQTLPHDVKEIASKTEKHFAVVTVPKVTTTDITNRNDKKAETIVNYDNLPERIDYYAFARHFSSKNQCLNSSANCDNLRGVAYIAWFILGENTFCITESRRTKVHKILYVRKNVLAIEALLDYSACYQHNMLYPVILNNLLNAIKGQTVEELLCDFVKRKLGIKEIKTEKDENTLMTSMNNTSSADTLIFIPKILKKISLSKDGIIHSLSKGLCPVITLKELCLEILKINSSGIIGSITMPNLFNNYFINRKEAIENINTQVIQSISMYNWIELLLNSVAKNIKGDTNQPTNTTNIKTNAAYSKQAQKEEAQKEVAMSNVISNKNEDYSFSNYSNAGENLSKTKVKPMDNIMSRLDKEYKQHKRTILNFKPDISEQLVLDEIWPSGKNMFQRRKYIGKNEFIYILLDSSIDNITIENDNIHYHIIGEGKDKRFGQDFRGNSNSLIRSTIYDNTKRILLFKKDYKNDVIFIDEIKCIGYKFVEEEETYRSLISFNFISLLRYQTNTQDNSSLTFKLDKGIELEKLETQNIQEESMEVNNNNQIKSPITKLQELYETREKLHSLGIELNADLERQLAVLEEEIIKNEIVPKLKKAVESTLQPVKRDLIFVVEYSPKEGVHVQLSRKRHEASNIVLEEKKVIQNNAEQSSNGSLQKLRVIFPDGEIIYERRVVDTLSKTIIKLGTEKVANVCYFARTQLLRPAGVFLVSKEYDSKYREYQRPLEDGWLLFTTTNTLTKKRQIEYLAEALGVKLTVEIV